MAKLPINDYLKIFEDLEHKVKECLGNISACHDFDHTLRVLNNSRQIAKNTKADLQIVEVAALCHDIGRAEEINSKGKICHAAVGAKKTREILKKYKLSEQFIDHTVDCVKTHRYRDDQKPQTLEAKIIYDADKLDSIGAVGIGRAFYFAGREGARLHNTIEEAINSSEYSIEDSAYREYLVKLRYIINNLLTTRGRELAKSRSKFMRDFFNTLNIETQLENKKKKAFDIYKTGDELV